MLHCIYPSPRPKQRLNWFSHFAGLTAQCPYTLQWAAPRPLKIAPSHGRSGPHPTHGFLGGAPESTPQMASQSNEQLFQGSQSCQTDRHTTSSVTIGRIYVVLRCGLIIHNNHNHSPNNTDRIVDDGRQRPNSWTNCFTNSAWNQLVRIHRTTSHVIWVYIQAHTHIHWSGSETHCHPLPRKGVNPRPKKHSRNEIHSGSSAGR